MLVHRGLPEKLSGCGIHGVRVGMQVAEIGYPSAAALPDADGSAHGKIGVKHPMDAAGFRAERINSALGASHKDAAARDGGLSKRARDSCKAEGPLEFQLGHLR